jgi:hypothetical protein
LGTDPAFWHSVLYAIPEGRAKALEAMWRSVHSSFKAYFAKHLNDSAWKFAELDERLLLGGKEAFFRMAGAPPPCG